MANTPKPITREDMYYNYLINGGDIQTLPKPITRREIYLNYLCQNGIGGGGDGITKEMLDAAVDAALQTAKAYTDDAVGGIVNFDVEVVDTLPTKGAEHTIYFVPNLNGTHDEYMYINNAWELIGNTTVDLTGYAKEEDIPTKTSELTNDSGFITSEDVTPEKIGALSVEGGEIADNDKSMTVAPNGIHGDDTQILDGFDKVEADRIGGRELLYNNEDIDERYVKQESVLNTVEEIDANTAEGYIADALVLKAIKSDLANSIDQINSNLVTGFYDRNTGTIDDINQWFDTGIYHTNPDTTANIGAFGYCMCVVFTTINWHYQILLPMWTQGKMWIRRGFDRNPNNWIEWKEFNSI